MSWMHGCTSEALWFWELQLACLSSITLLLHRHASASVADAVNSIKVLLNTVVSCLYLKKKNKKYLNTAA